MIRIKSQQTPYLVLFILGIILYSNTLSHQYVLDDFSVIKDNYIVQKGLDGLPEIFKTHYRQGYGFTQGNLYRPLSLSFFALQWELFPDSPSFAHACSIFLYAISLLLLFHFLAQIIENKFLVFLSCLLFASHPIHTEVVANIKSVDEILAFIFFLSSMLLLLRFQENKKKLHFFLSLFLFFLGFLSKESMISYLGIIPLFLMLFQKFSFKKAVQTTLPYLFSFAAYLLLRVQALGSISGDKTVASIDNMLMAAPDKATQLATAIKIMGLYLWKLLLPHPLINDYSLQQISFATFSSLETWLSILAYTAIFYAIWKFWKSRPYVSFSLAFFLISIALYSNIFLRIGTSFGERLLFVPSLGFCLLLAYLITHLFKEENLKNIQYKSKSFLLIALLTLLYGFKTIDRNKAWEDNFSLYATDIENCPNSARCQYYYGLGLMKERAILLPEGPERTALIQQAIVAFTNSLEILPKYSDAWGQRGLAYYRLGQIDAALYDYKKSIEYNPSNATTWSNMGSIYFERKQYQEALNAYGEAIKAKPNHVDALANYGSTLGTLGDFNSAITYFKKALALKPNEAEYYRLIALTYQNLGNKEQAQLYMNKYAAIKGQ